jgi:hypothetical protein
MSRCIIDATRPYEWIDKFPKIVEIPRELRERMATKFKDVLA